MMLQQQHFITPPCSTIVESAPVRMYPSHGHKESLGAVDSFSQLIPRRILGHFGKRDTDRANSDTDVEAKIPSELKLLDRPLLTAACDLLSSITSPQRRGNAYNMSDFDALLADYTRKGAPKVHGLICKCVDKNGWYSLQSLQEHIFRVLRLDIGNEIYSKISGYDSLSEDAAPLRADAVLQVASATKLITSIALLQCVERQLIGLDEPISKILPELADKDILTEVSGSDFVFERSKTEITARHLLSHTSGLGYPFTHPLLQQWTYSPTGKKEKGSYLVTTRYSMPLVFEPGAGWLYGCSLDWAGVAVSRMNNGMSLEDYMIENIWKKVGLSSPFPRFNISKHPEYNARVMQGVAQTSDGNLEPCVWPFSNPEDQEGGSGLSSTAGDYLAVLSDLVSDSPKLLKAETVSMMFTPQIVPGSPSIPMLLGLRGAWDTVSGPISDDAVNHGLGGLLLLGPVPEINQPKNILAWGGASNVVWFACRDKGVAGFFATQQAPFGNPIITELVNAWKKDFWTTLYKQ